MSAYPQRSTSMSPPSMPNPSHNSLTRISDALSRAQAALDTSSVSVFDLETKIFDTKSEITSISQQINDLRALMAKKYDEQEAYEDLLPLAMEEQERAATRVKRLQGVLHGVERHLSAEVWYEEEEMEDYAEGAKAERFKRYLREVGRGQEANSEPDSESDLDYPPPNNGPIALNLPFRQGDLDSGLRTDIRVPSPLPAPPQMIPVNPIPSQPMRRFSPPSPRPLEEVFIPSHTMNMQHPFVAMRTPIPSPQPRNPAFGWTIRGDRTPSVSPSPPPHPAFRPSSRNPSPIPMMHEERGPMMGGFVSPRARSPQRSPSPRTPGFHNSANLHSGDRVEEWNTRTRGASPRPPSRY